MIIEYEIYGCMLRLDFQNDVLLFEHLKNHIGRIINHDMIDELIDYEAPEWVDFRELDAFAHICVSGTGGGNHACGRGSK